MNVPAEERSSWQIICEDAAPRPAHRPRIWRDCEYIHRNIGAPCRDAIFLVGTSADSNPDDGGGLHLLVNPDGARYWRMAYRYHRRQ
jgi:hypothetical protein